MVPGQGAPVEHEVFFALCYGRVLVPGTVLAGPDRREAVGVGGGDRGSARFEEMSINSASHIERVVGPAIRRQRRSLAHCTVAQFGGVHAPAGQLPCPGRNREAIFGLAYHSRVQPGAASTRLMSEPAVGVVPCGPVHGSHLGSQPARTSADINGRSGGSKSALSSTVLIPATTYGQSTANWKSCVGKLTVGSNPTLSAREVHVTGAAGTRRYAEWSPTTGV